MQISCQCFSCGALIQRYPSDIRSQRVFCSQACLFADVHAKAAVRFWAKVKKTSTCWLWTGAVNRQGYGVARFVLNGRAPNKAHRVSWMLHHGPLLLPEIFVLHRCDVPPCVNPAHLYLGTSKDNTQDAISRGRFHWNHFRPGEERTAAKLTWGQVDAIRSLHAHGHTLRPLGRQFGVHWTTIHDLVKHRTRKEETRPAASK